MSDDRDPNSTDDEFATIDDDESLAGDTEDGDTSNDGTSDEDAPDSDAAASDTSDDEATADDQSGNTGAEDDAPDEGDIDDDGTDDEEQSDLGLTVDSIASDEDVAEVTSVTIETPLAAPNLLDAERPLAPPTQWPEPEVSPAAPREPRWFDGIRITAPLVILSLLMAGTFLMFVGIEPTPRWLLLFAAVMAILGTDGMLRDAWPRPFHRVRDRADTTPYLFLPALLAVSIPLLIEHNVRGYFVVPAALLGAVLFTAVLAAQVTSVRIAAPAYPLARLVATGAAYFSAFTLLSLSYVLDLGLLPALIAAAIVGTMLGVEIFREGQVDPIETLIFSGVTGLVLAEVRWTLYFIPVGGYLAGLTLVLAFFLVSGLLHSHLTRHLNRMVAAEYVAITTAGIVLVALASQAGLA